MDQFRFLQWKQTQDKAFVRWLNEYLEKRDFDNSQDLRVLQGEMLLLGFQHPQEVVELQQLCQLQELQEFEKLQQAVLNPLLSHPPVTPIFDKYIDRNHASNKHNKIVNKPHHHNHQNLKNRNRHKK